jgi:DNA polymerase, archaea type
MTKTPAQYLEIRESRRELSYEAMLASGRKTWRIGDRVRVYRTQTGSASVVEEGVDRRDYDVDHYVRVLRETFAERLSRAFTPDDFAALFADPLQPSLFPSSLETIRSVLQPSAPQSSSSSEYQSS